MIIQSTRTPFLTKKYDIPDSSRAILLDFSEPKALEDKKGWNEVAKTIAGGATGTVALNAGIEGYKISQSTQLKDVVKFATSIGVSEPVIDAHAKQTLEVLKSHATRGISVFIIGAGGTIAALEVADKYFDLGWSTKRKLITASTIGLMLVAIYFLLVKAGVIV